MAKKWSAGRSSLEGAVAGCSAAAVARREKDGNSRGEPDQWNPRRMFVCWSPRESHANHHQTHSQGNPGHGTINR